MAEIGKRIRTRREAMGITQEELAKKLGYKSKTTIAKIEIGVNDIAQSKVVEFAAALGTTPAYLMGWEETETIYPSNLVRLSEKNFKKVPLLGSIACGTPILAEENILEYINMETDVHADFALRCQGDSMINARIFDGDIVYIKIQPQVENGDIAAVRIDDVISEATLKRIYIDDEKIRLSAENPMHKDIIYYKEEMNKVHVLGKAVAFLSSVK